MSKIQWTDQSWNPFVGCSEAGPECDNCYAKIAANSARLQQFEQYQKVKNWDSVVTAESQLLKPFGIAKPQTIFVNSMSDTFHETVKNEWLDAVFAAMAIASNHTFQVLTKRPKRMQKYINSLTQERLYEASQYFWKEYQIPKRLWRPRSLLKVYFENLTFPLPNVWLGTSIGLQKSDWRVAELKKTLAAVRFLSCEPLLENLSLDLNGIDWVIVGGESGNGINIRPTQIEDIRSIIAQCKEQGVAPFLKHVGSRPYLNGSLVRLKDRKGGNFDEFPDELNDLKVREFPARH